MRIAPPEYLAARIQRLRTTLAAQQLDALLVSSPPNVAYLSGLFASSSALVLTTDAVLLLTDSRYRAALEARAEEWPEVRAIELEGGVSLDDGLVEVLAPLHRGRVGFEATHLTVRRHRHVVTALAARGWRASLVETDGLVEELRARKDSWEIARLRDGGDRLSSAAKYILSKPLAGLTESDVAAGIEARLRAVGFERPAFDTIVAAGPNAALPHGRAGSRRIEDGDLVVLDFGGVLDGYCTDLTRTVVAGGVAVWQARDRERELIDRVVAAQEAAFEATAAGVQPEAVDAAARAALERHGLADAFTHGTGHGLGLEIHEAPRLTRLRTTRREPPLAAGMVMTLEPGVYFPGWGGVRIEDDVLVSDGGAEWLTDVPRTL